MHMTAALARGNEGPLELASVELAEPAPHEILVRVVATGLCHTDLTALRHAPLTWPAVLGHEGAGIVEQLGAAVTKVKPGDPVVMTTTSCGACPSCRRRNPSNCRDFVALNMSGGRRADGSCTHRHAGEPVFAKFLGQSSFATHALADERSVVKLDTTDNLELMAPLGCGVMTGVGAVLNTLRVVPGTSFAVFGAGAVGLSALMAARLSGCITLIAVDRVASRLGLARELGATHVIDAAAGDPVAAIRAITGDGVDYAVEASGAASVMAQTLESLGYGGCAALVGIAPAAATIAVSPKLLQSRGLIVKGSLMAGEGAEPEVFIPRLVAFWHAGMLPFDRLVSFYPFSAINDAIRDATDGSVIKPVLRMPALPRPSKESYNS